MKILIISDCHANIDALNAVWEKESDCDYIVFAGDMVDYGFNPRESVQWFMERNDKLFAVRGNHDGYIIEGRHTNKGPYDHPRNFQELMYSQLTDVEYDFLESLPFERTFTIGDIDFYICHMTSELSDIKPYAELQISQWNTRALSMERFATKFPDASSPKRCIVYGHTHIQWIASAGPNSYVMNPGSLSYHFGSFEPVRCADYIVYEDGNFGLRHIDFDTEHLYKRAEEFEDPEAARLARAFFRKV